MQKYWMVVMTNCEPGQDAEFNDWYDRIHIPDVLKVPGVVAAQRFQLTKEQRRPTPPGWGYLAVYEVESDNLPATFEVMNRELATVYKSPSMNRNSWAYFFQPIGKRQVKAGAKRAGSSKKPAKTGKSSRAAVSRTAAASKTTGARRVGKGTKPAKKAK